MISLCDQEGEATQTQRLLSELWVDSQLSMAVGFFFFFVFMYLNALGLSCSTRDLQSTLRHGTLGGGMWDLAS